MPRAGLDQKTVLKVAAELVDVQGVDQLTLAQLASQLKIRTPSLYNYVDGLSGLKRDLAVLGIQELLTRFRRAAIGKTRDEAVMALANAYRAYAKEHPGLYALSQQASDPDDSEWQAAGQEVVEIVLIVLATYNLSQEDALHAVRGLRSIVHGFVLLETSGGFGLALKVDESFRRLVTIFINGLRVGFLGSTAQ